MHKSITSALAGYYNRSSKKAQVRIDSLIESNPNLWKKTHQAEFIDTLGKKAGGADYAAIISQGLPILEKWAAYKKTPPVVLEFLGTIEYHGTEKAILDNPWAKAMLGLCGRSEAAHARGKKIFHNIAGDAGDSSNKKVMKDRATQMLNKMLVLEENRNKRPKPASAS